MNKINAIRWIVYKLSIILLLSVSSNSFAKSEMFTVMVRLEKRTIGSADVKISPNGQDLLISKKLFESICAPFPVIPFCELFPTKGEFLSLQELSVNGKNSIKFYPQELRLDIKFSSDDNVIRHLNDWVAPSPVTPFSSDKVEKMLAYRKESSIRGSILRRLLKYASPDDIKRLDEPKKLEAIPVKATLKKDTAKVVKPKSIVQKEKPKPVKPIDSSSSMLTGGVGFSIKAKRSNIDSGKGSSTINDNGDILNELKGMHEILAEMLKISPNVDSQSSDEIIKNSGLDDIAPKDSPMDSLALAKADSLEFAKATGGLSQEDLFARAFGRKPPKKPLNYTVQLFLDGEFIENVEVELHKDNRMKFRFSSNKLDNIFRETLLDSVYRVVGSSAPIFTSDQLSSVQFDYQLDEDEFTLTIDVKFQLKKDKSYSVKNDPTKLSGIKIKPATLSAFLNVAGNVTYNYHENFFDNDSIKELYLSYYGDSKVEYMGALIDFDGAVNLKGVVLEASMFWDQRNLIRYNNSNNLDGFELQDGRLLYDNIKLRQRYTAGAVSLGGGSVSGVDGNIYGVRIDKELTKFMSVSRTDRKDEETIGFVLESPASVTLFLNGRKVKRLHLGSGQHYFSGITGKIGQNEGYIEIEYNNGKETSVPISFYRAQGVDIGIGELDYSAAFGVGRPSDKSWDKRYDIGAGSIAGSGFIRYGWKEYFTPGVAIAAAPNKIFMALEGGVKLKKHRHTTLIGSYGVNSKTKKNGYKIQGTFSQQIKRASLGLGAAYTDRDFFSDLLVDKNKSGNLVKTDLNINVSAPVWRGRATVTGHANFKRESVADATAPVNKRISYVDYNLNARYNVNIIQGLNISATFDYNVNNYERFPQLFLNVSYFFGKKNHSVFVMDQLMNKRVYNPPTSKLDKIYVDSNITIDTVIYTEGFWENRWSNMVMGSWNWNRNNGLNGGSGAGINLSYWDKTGSYRFQSSHTFNRIFTDINYSLSDNKRNDAMSRNHTFNGVARTSLMFADGVFSADRYTMDGGFVLVKGVENVKGVGVRINPNNISKTEYSISGLLPAAYGQLSEYNSEHIRLELKNAPKGVWLDENLYYALGTYKRGHVIKVGKPATILVRAKIIDESGDPLIREFFTVAEVSRSNVEVTSGFTSGTGFFQAGGLSAGKKYRIRFSKNSFIKDLYFDTPKKATGFITLEPFTVDHQVIMGQK